ncbi:MAG TPA: inorganic diphosphatase [Desulfobacteria bacterium]|nr:inorganic diphosphatase [Desulfobacteria bacterium]
MEVSRSIRNVAFKFGRTFRWLFLLSILFSGVAYSAEQVSSGITALSPSFAPPCSANGTCRELDSCADADFGRCKGFKGISGLRRVLAGSFGSLAFRAQIVNRSGKPVSLWHDIPLVVSDDEKGFVVNAYFEVSRGTQAKVELNKWEPHNPMWQDRKKVKNQNFKRPRYYAWSPAPGNYGALPRTWENVLEDDPLTGFPGDTDPIDVVDVGSAPCPLGLVYPVKVIGALGMIDGTDLQTDWKIYVINIKDPMAEKINDIWDVLQEIRDQWGIFWRFYKTAKGLRENFFYDPKSSKKVNADPVWLGATDARKIVLSSAAAYEKLVSECLNRKVNKPYWVPGCSP